MALFTLELVLDHTECFTLSSGEDNLLLLVTLGFQDLRLTTSIGDVDVGLPRALRRQNLGALAPLSLRLQSHTVEDLLGRLDITDFVPKQRDAPF